MSTTIEQFDVMVTEMLASFEGEKNNWAAMCQA